MPICHVSFQVKKICNVFKKHSNLNVILQNNSSLSSHFKVALLRQSIQKELVIRNNEVSKQAKLSNKPKLTYPTRNFPNQNQPNNDNYLITPYQSKTTPPCALSSKNETHKFTIAQRNNLFL